MQRRSFTLFIPHEDKLKLLELTKRLHNERKEISNWWEKLKAFTHSAAIAINIMSDYDLDAAWYQCVAKVEARGLTKISIFRQALLDELRNFFYLPEYFQVKAADAECKLRDAVSTAITKSLFLQYDQESDLDYCIEHLYASIDMPAVWTSWKEIDTKSFSQRIKDQYKWSLYHRLFLSGPKDKNEFDTKLFMNIGLVESDFMAAFYESNTLPHSSYRQQIHGLPIDIIRMIASHLSGRDLLRFHQVSYYTYNAIESDFTLRLRHRTTLPLYIPVAFHF